MKMNLPDRIFTAGGAGKEIALTLLESDWVLERIIEPDVKPDSLQVTILDTAEGESRDDKSRIQEIRQRRDSLQQEYRETTDGRVGSVTIDYELITQNIQLDSHIDLLGDTEVERITGAHGMDPGNWWITRDHINENLDFARGVVRKRGLGKAIYYKAFAEDDSISSAVDLPQKGRVAVLAGLGGGTGSGILFDLAEHVQDKQPAAEVTLFGILPTHRESEKVSTNAYAALSELEYLALSDNAPFKDNILVPIDPTGYKGKTGNQIDTSDTMQEFDEAIIYLIASYYSTDRMEDPFTGTPKFAPFTMGIPQVLRYNVEAINQGRETIREALEQKQNANETEQELYLQVERFLQKYYDAPAEGSLREPNEADISSHFENIEDLLDFDLFTELDYYTIDVFRNQLEEAKSEGGTVSEQLDIVRSGLQAVSFEHSDKFVDDIDRRLAKILRRDVELLGERKDTLLHKQAVTESDIQDAITYLLAADDGTITPGIKLQQMETKLEDFEDRLEDRRSELEESREELEEKQQEYDAEVNRIVNDFERAVGEDLETLSRIQDRSIDSELHAIETELQGIANEIRNAERVDEVDNVETNTLQEEIDALADSLATLDIDISATRQDIQSSIEHLRKARVADIKTEKEEGTLDKIAPWKSSVEEEKEEAFKTYRMEKSQLDDSGIFALGDGEEFVVRVEFQPQDLQKRVDEKRRDLEASIEQAFVDRLEEENHPEIDELDRMLTDNPSVDETCSLLRRAVREELGETDELEERIDELEEEIETLEERVEIYDAAIDLFQDLTPLRQEFAELRSAFKTELEEYGLRPTQSVQTEEEEYAYVKNLRPNKVFSATRESDIAASDLLHEEQGRVRRGIEELAKNARSERYTGLYQRTMSHDQTRYQDMKIRVAVASRGVDNLDSETLDVEPVFQESYTIREGARAESRGYSSWQVETGDRWDIGLSVFISGVFLDNIRKMVQPDGFRDGYEARKSRDGQDISIHHSYGLENGEFVRRTDLLNLASDDDLAFFLRDESEIVSDLLEDYVEVESIHEQADMEAE